MIIDFHAHIFPDKIAEGAVSTLAKKGNIPAYSDGKETTLIAEMERAGITLSVNLPVLTRPEQFLGTMRYAAEINKKYDTGRGILSFAGIHPNIPDLEGAIFTIRDAGFRGIKIHPDYQGAFIDDERYVRMLSLAKAADLITVTHAGVDAAYVNEEIKCAPTRILRLLDKIGGYEKLVLAHLGGNQIYRDVYDSLAGEDLYFDTGYILGDIKKERFTEVLSKHGEDKILFGSDSPWRDVAEDVKIVRDFGLGNAEEKIFYLNAKRLLGI